VSAARKSRAPASTYTPQKPTYNGYLLDTKTISELTKPRPNKGLLQFLASVPEYRLFLSVLTIGEIVSGIHRLPESNKKRDLWTWLTTDLVARFNERMLSVDFKCAHLWGQWEAESRKKGEVLPAIDTLLAATAFSNGLAIVTRNSKHFKKLNVRVENPWT
jgi:predicted nucleic acid-binding protein